MSSCLTDSTDLNRRLLHLDVLRGVAVVMVLLHHNWCFPELHGPWYGVVSLMNRMGTSGVDFFFVLSGFLVGGLLLDERVRSGTIRPGRFLVRRAFKTWPNYLVYLVVYVAAQGVASVHAGGTFSGGVSKTLAWIWPNFLHLQSYFPSTSGVGWLWSLAVEEHFYLLLPPILIWLTRSGIDVGKLARAWMVLAVFCLAARAVTMGLLIGFSGEALRQMDSATWFILKSNSHLRFDGLFLGVLLAAVVRFAPERVAVLRNWRWLLFAGGVGCFMTQWVLVDGHEPLMYPFGFCLQYLAGAAFVLCAWFADTSPPRPAGLAARLWYGFLKIWAWVGVRSFAIYVWQGYFAKPIANRLSQHLGGGLGIPGWRGSMTEWIYVLVPILLGALLFAVVENPCLRLRDRWFPSRTRTPAVPAPVVA